MLKCFSFVNSTRKTDNNKIIRYECVVDNRLKSPIIDRKGSFIYCTITLLVADLRTPPKTMLIARLKVLYHRQCQYTQANEYHFDGANSIETTNH